MEVITRLDPLTYGIDGVRESLIGSGTFGLGIDMLVVIAIAVILLGIGSYLFERIQA
jgi:ABC-2 type transport system permease protein